MAGPGKLYRAVGSTRTRTAPTMYACCHCKKPGGSSKTAR